MPRYCFHVYDAADGHDHTPHELAHLDAARIEARRVLGEILKGGRDEPPPRVDVCDHQGLTLISLHYAEIDAPAAACARGRKG